MNLNKLVPILSPERIPSIQIWPGLKVTQIECMAGKVLTLSAPEKVR